MLDDLVQRDIVEKARLVVLRIEDADAGLQAVALGDAPDILVHLASVGVAAACLVIGERLAEPAADIEHPDVARYPAERRRPLPRSEEHTSELQSRGLISYAAFC